MTNDHAETDRVAELAERVRRLEDTLAAMQAHIGAHTGQGPFRTAAAGGPAAATEAAPARDLEAHVGTYWLSRAGILALVVGLAFFITTHFGDLGAFTRVALGYLLSGALAGGGLWLARRHRLFGHVIFGGGLAIAYFVTYALHFVPAVRVIDSEVVALLLLAVVAVGIVAAAQRLASETVAGIAFFLGFHTSILGGTSTFSLLATSVLAGGGVFFLLRNRWVIVPLSSLVAVYTSHVVWAIRTDDRSLAVSLGFLVVYTGVFTVALLARPHGLSNRVGAAFALLTVAGFVGLGAHELVPHDRAWLCVFFAATALALAVAGGAAARRQAPWLVEVYAGASLLTAAAAVHQWLDGGAFVVTWGVLGVLGVMVGRWLATASLRIAGLSLLSVALVVGFWVESLFVPAALAAAFVAAERREHTGQEMLSRVLRAISAGGAGLALVRTMTMLLPTSCTTLSWVFAAFALVGGGLALRDRTLRLVGLGVLALGVGRLFLFDLSRLGADTRIVTFILLGVTLLTLSFTYTRLRERLKQWL